MRPASFHSARSLPTTLRTSPTNPTISLQGYLAHKKPPSPQDFHRALGIGLLQGPSGRRFLVSEVPLYGCPTACISRRAPTYPSGSQAVPRTGSWTGPPRGKRAPRVGISSPHRRLLDPFLAASRMSWLRVRGLGFGMQGLGRYREKEREIARERERKREREREK